MENTTVWEDLWGYLHEVYSGVDGYYENISLGNNSILSIRLVVLGLFLGVIIACIAMAYNKQILGGFVRKLLTEECRGADSAKNLFELGYIKNPFIRSAVQKSVSMRRVVRCVEEDEFYERLNAEREEYEKKRAEEPSLPKFREIEYRVNASEDHFYIPENMSDMAERKFYAKGSSWLTTIIAIVVLCIAFFVLLLVLPNILHMVDQFIGSFKSNDPYSR
ncbi:MAG: hypothetical protein J6L85_04995 [Clostridia bacterium]|nr:hypothetical protein [Clostridia bacterium]